MGTLWPLASGGYSGAVTLNCSAGHGCLAGAATGRAADPAARGPLALTGAGDSVYIRGLSQSTLSTMWWRSAAQGVGVSAMGPVAGRSPPVLWSDRGSDQ